MAKVIFVVGAQKLVPTLASAHERIYQHSLPPASPICPQATGGVP